MLRGFLGLLLALPLLGISIGIDIGSSTGRASFGAASGGDGATLDFSQSENSAHLATTC